MVSVTEGESHTENKDVFELTSPKKSFELLNSFNHHGSMLRLDRRS